MPIAHIANGEAGLSVRNKLNLVIDGVNSEIVPPTSLDITYTGSLPFEMPAMQVAPWWGYVKEPISGDSAVYPGTGVGIYTDLSFADARGLLTAIDFTNLGAILGGGYAGGTAALPPGITLALNALTSFKADALVSVAGQVNIASTSLATISLASLARTGGNMQINATSAPITSIPLGALIRVGGSFSVRGSVLTSVSVANLKRAVVAFNCTACPVLPSISAPALTHVAQLSMAACPMLTTVTTPALIYLGSVSLQGANGAIANVTLGTIGTMQQCGTPINISGQALTAASVNGILALLVSLDGTGGTTLWGAGKTVDLSGGTSAAPSGQGILDKATLIARTATVGTN